MSKVYICLKKFTWSVIVTNGLSVLRYPIICRRHSGDLQQERNQNVRPNGIEISESHPVSPPPLYMISPLTRKRNHS